MARGEISLRVNGKEVVYQLNGKTMAGKAGGQSFEILPGDTITVAQSIF